MMLRAFLKTTAFFTPNLDKRPSLSLVRIGASVQHPLRFFSSESDSSKLAQASQADGSADPEDVSNQELRKRIEKYLDKGDVEAIPSIFEAILKRKLSGKHDESDEELMQEFRGEYREQPISIVDVEDLEEEEEKEGLEAVEDFVDMYDDSSSSED